ncbi:MAG: branched-chain amino acid ABC transporter permease [Anaerolineae bacterium]
MTKQTRFDFVDILRLGLLAGVVLLFLSLVGMVESFAARDIIYQKISLSITLILISNFVFGYITARQTGRGRWLNAILGGLIVGGISTAMLSLLVVVAEPLNLRNVLVNASPALVKTLTFENETITRGLMPLIGLGISSSLLGAIIYMLPPRWRRAILTGLVFVIALGTLEELVSDIVTNIFDLLGNKKGAKSITDIFFARKGLSVLGRAIVFVVATALSWVWNWQGPAVKQKTAQMPAGVRQGSRIAALALLLLVVIFVPRIVGSYLSEILVTVAIFTLMGFGLNIVVGFAGLLDLGYVAFFAIGAYTMALLTSTQLPQTTQLTGVGMSFWAALPIAVGVSALWGILLGVPVLRMRGDYLAIVTLGFGEIIRILALSNFLQPKVGGAQGILGVSKPVIAFNALGLSFNLEMKTSQDLYYLVIVACVLAAFIAWRMRDSRAGRSWMAMREDEDVAEAMGINLIKTKLLAFATGGAFSGLAGAIFAAKLGSIYPHSFNLLISINVLCLIIVGGIGSLPGVVIGAVALVGLPELLREFSEFRLLIFGALLVSMMLLKPEGFWPAAAQRRELHTHDESEPLPTPDAA